MAFSAVPNRSPIYEIVLRLYFHYFFLNKKQNCSTMEEHRTLIFPVSNFVLEKQQIVVRFI